MALSRIKQRVAEKLGSAQKTNYDANFDAQVRTAQVTKEQVDRLIDKMEAFLQPDPAVRISALCPPENNMKLEVLSQAIYATASKIEAGQPFTKGLSILSEAELAVAADERLFIARVDSSLLSSFKQFLNDHWKTLVAERKKLESARISMDSVKNSIRNCKKKDDMEALEVKLKDTTTAFEEQAETVKNLLDQYPLHHEMILTQLREFMRKQLQYHKSVVEKLTAGLHKIDVNESAEVSAKKSSKSNCT